MVADERGPVVGRRQGTVAVLVAATLWGTLGIAQEVGAPQAAPATVAGVRSLGGGLALLVWVLLTGCGPRLRAAVRQAPGAVAAAVVSITVFQLAYLTGVRAVGVALGVLIAIGSAPAFAGLLAALTGRRPGRRWLLATAATVAGAAVLLLAGGGDAGQDPSSAGVVVGLLAGAAYGTYTTVSVRLVQAGADGTSTVALTFTGAGLLLLPVLVTGDMSWTGGARGVTTVLWLTLGTTAVGYALFARGLKSLDAPTVTTLTLAEPLAATVLAVVVIQERLSASGWVGAALLVAGLLAVAPLGRRAGATRGRALPGR